jgi:hypothetical protein
MFFLVSAVTGIRRWEWLGKIRLWKAEFQGEGWKEVEFKMSCGDTWLNNNVV